jgi:hypothetical protein
MANAVLTMVLPRSLRRVGRILADPLPPRLSASALQVTFCFFFFAFHFVLKFPAVLHLL